MKIAKLADACAYLVAASVIFALVAAFVGQLNDGATAQEAQEHYNKVSQPIILTASEAAEAQLAAANEAVEAKRECIDGSCNKPTAKRRVRRGIIFRWRRR